MQKILETKTASFVEKKWYLLFLNTLMGYVCELGFELYKKAMCFFELSL